jgi:hypothetical protein
VKKRCQTDAKIGLTIKEKPRKNRRQRRTLLFRQKHLVNQKNKQNNSKETATTKTTNQFLNRLAREVLLFVVFKFLNV